MFGNEKISNLENAKITITSRPIDYGRYREPFSLMKSNLTENPKLYPRLMNVLQPYHHNSAMASTSGVLYPYVESTVIDEIRKVPTNSSTAQLIC